MAGPIPAATFYGSSGRRSVPVAAQLEAAAARLQRATVCRLPRPTLLGPAATWRVFPRQAAALQAAADCPSLRLMVFGCEERVSSGGGRRSYLVCHPSLFWQCDQQKRPEDRCSYEVIRQDAPCKIYLDLEFDRALNPDRDGDAMVDVFIRVIAAVVDHLFKMKCTRRDVMDLSASSEKKFSRHLIFCCKDMVFRDNITVGNLVKDVCDAIKMCVFHDEVEDIHRLGLLEFSKDKLSLLVVNSDNGNGLFCDEGVYTKNRNFRVYKSTKFGKRRPLVKSVHNKYVPRAKPARIHRGDPLEEAFFLDSLVSHIEGAAKPLEYQTRSSLGASVRPPAAGSRGCCWEGDGPAASPYPDIDRFVRSLVSPGGIRRWSYFADSECLVYDIVGFRYCRNVGRWHRSNNIIIVVSLREASFYQKCHDPACQGFRSDGLPLPDGLLPWPDMDEWDAGGGADGGEFPDCGASDSEMLSAAALAEPAADGAMAESARTAMKDGVAEMEPDPAEMAVEAVEMEPNPTGMADGAAEMEHGQAGMASGAAEMGSDPVGGAVEMEPGPVGGAVEMKPGPVAAAIEITTPDLFPDCGVEDEELADMPAGDRQAQDGDDGQGRVSDVLPGPFPDCGVEDSEILEELSTEPLPNCGVGDWEVSEDQLIEPLPSLSTGDEPPSQLSARLFPDCGVGDGELSAVRCSGGQCPVPAVGRRALSDLSTDMFPDCGVADGELLDVPADMFPVCSVGDWEPSEVGRSAGATVAAAAAAADTTDTTDTAVGSDQQYYTAPDPSVGCDLWDDLPEADILHW